MNCEQLITKLMLDIRKIRPYYSAIFESMEKVETLEIKTVGVSMKRIVYNPYYLQNTPYEKLLFVMLHEIHHVGLKHPVRCIGLNHEVTNIAADLIVNK